MTVLMKNNKIDSDNHPANANTIHVGEKPKSISFSGCGFLGVYHIGVASCIKTHAPNWLKGVDRIYGCSVGSIIAAMLINDVDLGEVCHRMMCIVKDARSRYLGPVSPGFKLNESLMRDMRCGLPIDAHERATGKLFISLTRVSDGKNVIVSDYRSREELIQVLLCSCFVPFYSGFFPPKYRGVRYVDGGLSNNLPAYDDTITVSPWSGKSDICPRNDGSVSLIDLSFVNTSIQVTASNFYRASTMFFPPKPEILKEFCSQGFRETVQYLRDHGLFESIHPLRNNMSFSSFLHKREERRKITRQLSYNARSLQRLNADYSISKAKNADSSASESSSSTNESNYIDTLVKESVMVECFDENDDTGSDESLDNDVLTLPEKAQKVFTVVHVYPVLDDHVIRIEFQLPDPLLTALEAALHPDTDSVWRKPIRKMLAACRQSVIVGIPLEKAYSLAYQLLSNVTNFPSEVTCFVDYLRDLVDRLQTHFKSSGDPLIELLRTASDSTKHELRLLACHMIIAVQAIANSLLKHELYPSSLLTSLANAGSNLFSDYKSASSFNSNLSPFLQMV